jgi:hypothetical protein
VVRLGPVSSYRFSLRQEDRRPSEIFRPPTDRLDPQARTRSSPTRAVGSRAVAKEESHGVLPPQTAYIEKSSGRWVRRDGLWAHPSRFDSRGWRSPSPLSG